MKVWIECEAPEAMLARLTAQDEAAEAILAASADLPSVDDMVLFDLQTPVATRFVALPVPHRHGQDCARA